MNTASPPADHWKFENNRHDGKIAVMFDNNMWDWLCCHRATFHLASELSREQFALYIPREVEIEHLAIPMRKGELRRFIGETIEACNIETTAYFGFASPPGSVQRHGGFGFGTFIPDKPVRRLEELRHHIRGLRPSGLAANESDVVLANHAFACVVVTRDSKDGPLRDAKNLGGKVLYVEDRHSTSGNLRSEIVAAWQ